MRPNPTTAIAVAIALIHSSLGQQCLQASDTESTAAQPAAQATETNPVATMIHWSSLGPDQGQPFVDPFAKLSNDLIADLGFVARVRRLIAEDKISADGRDAKEAAEISQRFEQQGVDIGWLMIQRDRVQQIRSLQVEDLSQAIAGSLRDKQVSLAGFAIPLVAERGRLTEFFLVPTIAACSHEDPPPRLQVVFVSTDQGIATPTRRTPVRVVGKLVANATSRATMNASGRVMVHAAYAIASAEVEVLPLSDGIAVTTKQ